MATVLLVHSHPVVRAGLGSVLGQAHGMRVVGEASKGNEALRLLQRTRPDVALIACSLAGLLDGPAVVKRIEAGGWGVRVLALSAPGDHGSIYRMWQAGAVGCISERAGLQSVVEAVEAAARGERLWTPEQTAQMERWWEDIGSKVEMLTGREKEVLVLMADGLTDRQIAERLQVSENTIHTHVRRVLGKLELATRQEAIVFALRKENCRKIISFDDDKLRFL